ncbi:MAG: AAA family ATPase, partial [Spirochaetaceae bacterium]|nr:AAA family ATPase [Spirochaetaceae bacterium]
LESAINNITAQIDSKNTEKMQKEAELQELEKQTTSIVPTRDGINRLLDTFGFTNFKLALGNEPHTYTLIREDGTDAANTLSEGEKSLLTFLYFYFLLKGSQSETGIDNDKIVVIDDPVSNLDENGLCIVSALIKELIQDVRENGSPIKQLFILTHNRYLYREVTFNGNANKDLSSEETFWLLKKKGNCSFVEKQTDL